MTSKKNVKNKNPIKVPSNVPYITPSDSHFPKIHYIKGVKKNINILKIFDEDTFFKMSDEDDNVCKDFLFISTIGRKKRLEKLIIKDKEIQTKIIPVPPSDSKFTSIFNNLPKVRKIGVLKKNVDYLQIVDSKGKDSETKSSKEDNRRKSKESNLSPQRQRRKKKSKTALALAAVPINILYEETEEVEKNIMGACLDYEIREVVVLEIYQEEGEEDNVESIIGEEIHIYATEMTSKELGLKSVSSEVNSKAREVVGEITHDVVTTCVTEIAVTENNLGVAEGYLDQNVLKDVIDKEVNEMVQVGIDLEKEEENVERSFIASEVGKCTNEVAIASIEGEKRNMPRSSKKGLEPLMGRQKVTWSSEDDLDMKSTSTLIGVIVTKIMDACILKEIEDADKLCVNIKSKNIDRNLITEWFLSNDVQKTERLSFAPLSGLSFRSGSVRRLKSARNTDTENTHHTNETCFYTARSQYTEFTSTSVPQDSVMESETEADITEGYLENPKGSNANGFEALRMAEYQDALSLRYKKSFFTSKNLRCQEMESAEMKRKQSEQLGNL